MEVLNHQQWIEEMNHLSINSKPFFFFISYDKSQAIVQELDVAKKFFKFKFNDFRSAKNKSKFINKKLQFQKSIITFDEYKKAYDKVKDGLNRGDTFLINLTFSTPIQMNFDLEEIYHTSHAKYKLLWPDKLTIFSPECFVKIVDGHIFSYPMKGTIDASLNNASDILIHDEKELSEHYTIVDLIRNDLSLVASDVRVTKFRYIDTIHTHDKVLLQTSSEISGKVNENYLSNLGSLMEKLLPAGSISGAPKQKTIQIINEAEMGNRGWYTGVFGYFDGKNLDSGVAIRFIEKNGQDYFYKSGGGITFMSKIEDEYNELNDKIYVPIGRKYLD